MTARCSGCGPSAHAADPLAERLERAEAGTTAEAVAFHATRFGTPAYAQDVVFKGVDVEA
jgi:hypothetical protein